MDFEFRDIKIEETDEAVTIEQICFPPNEACSRKAMTERIKTTPGTFMVAIDKANGKIAGFLNGVCTNELIFRDEFFTDISLHNPDGKAVMLLGLDVLPEYRNKGLAREIVRQYARREKAKGRKYLFLTCLEGKVNMYKKFGFIDNGIANSTWGGEEWHEMKYALSKAFDVLKPVIPGKTFNVIDFGAVSGGKVSNTKAFNLAIEKANAEGGGKVIIPAGIWLTGPIELKSNVELHAMSGAYILFDKKRQEYPLFVADYEGQPRIRTVSPIHAYECENIAITGDGIFDGNGELWRPVKDWKVTGRQWQEMLKKSPYTVPQKEGEVWLPSKSIYDAHNTKVPEITDVASDTDVILKEASKYYDYYRPVMVSLVKCNKILLDGVTFQNSPAWNVHPLFCRNLTISNLNIKNPYYAQNGDGLDLESCQEVEIFNTSLDVGDDALCMKAGKDAIARTIDFPTKDVYIHDCIVYHGHGGFVVGSEMSRGVQDVVVENCSFLGTDVGLRFKSAIPRGGKVCDIDIDGIQMANIKNEAIIFEMSYVLGYTTGKEDKPAESVNMEDVPEFCDIHMSHIECLGAKQAVKINGLPQLPIHDISVRNSVFDVEKGNEIKNAENIEL